MGLFGYHAHTRFSTRDMIETLLQTFHVLLVFLNVGRYSPLFLTVFSTMNLLGTTDMVLKKWM